jgi:hypothetical protein
METTIAKKSSNETTGGGSGSHPDNRALFCLSATKVRSWIKATRADIFAKLRKSCGTPLVRILSDWLQAGSSSTQRSLRRSGIRNTSGLSVIVIHDSKVGMLEQCLSSVQASVQRIEEPIEVMVISDALPSREFRTLDSKLSLRLIEINNRFSFARAFRAGIDQALHPWVYLVGSQYVLEESTLPELLMWRAPHMFAIGSMKEAVGNWMFVGLENGIPEPEYRELDTRAFARGALGVSPDASLYNREVLIYLLAKRYVYDSPDFANLEWGIRSWRMGFETILCPKSRLHGSPAAPPQNPIHSEADSLRFLLRNTFSGAADLTSVIRKAIRSEAKTCWDLLNPIALASYRASRSLEQAFQHKEIPLDSVKQAYFIQPHQHKPTLVFATPYVLFPPSHGSAVGMSYLLSALAQLFSVHILSDESEAYSGESLPYFAPFATVRLLSGRIEDPEKLHDRIARIESHSRAEMKEILRMLISDYRPRFVEIEHVELAKLIEARENPHAKWILNLHDVFLSEESPGASAEDRYELNLIGRFDSIICCSPEDASILGKSNVAIVPNAVDLASISYEPSPRIPRILFIGPWRSPQNIPGIRAFLDLVYPHLLQSLDNVELWYLGGKGVQTMIDSDTRFNQRGVQVLEYVDNVQELMKQCALTINPISGNRGSCRKVAESLAGGRVCVSTREGARGYLDVGFSPLLICEKTEDFTGLMLKLLEDVEYRRSLECLNEDQRYMLSAIIIGPFAELYFGPPYLVDKQHHPVSSFRFCLLPFCTSSRFWVPVG